MASYSLTKTLEIWLLIGGCATITARITSHNIPKTNTESFPVAVNRQEEIFKAANKTPNNIEYVGCGYDMYGISDMDENSGFSLNNYRSPIFDSYNFKEGALGEQLDRFGIWVSNEFLCDISLEFTSVKSQQKLKSMVNTHVEIRGSKPFGSFRKVMEHSDTILNTLRRFRRVIIKKYECTVYSAGLVSIRNRRSMKRFNKILQKVIKGCKGSFSEESCPVTTYNNSVANEGCNDCVVPWMRFFEDFGTHITSRVTMGGIIRKFTNYRKKDANQDQSKQKKRYEKSSSWFGISRKLVNTTDASELHDDRRSQEDDILQYTVGPEPKDDSLSSETFEDWVWRVAYNPVPIQTEFTPLYELMPDEEAKKMYREALIYYAKVKGATYGKESITTHRTENFLIEMMKKATVVTLNGPREVNKDVCHNNSSILFGFGVNLNQDRQILELKTCLTGLNACILDYNPDVKSTFIVAYCGETTGQEINQKLIMGSARFNVYSEAKCPKYYVIGLGFIIQFGNPMFMRSCPQGNASCGHHELGLNGLIWIVCFPQNTFGLNLYDTKAAVNKAGIRSECKRKSHRAYSGKADS